MTRFTELARQETRHKYTDNGAKALSSVGNPLLDLFGTVGAARSMDDNTLTTMLAESFKYDPLRTMKLVFYTRDIRGDRLGKGERATSRRMLKWLAKHHPAELRPNVKHIPEFGRWDDLYCLVDTPCEEEMWTVLHEQFMKDLDALSAGGTVSLLGKWMPSVNTTSASSKKLGKMTAKAFSMTEKEYRKNLSALRTHLRVVEKDMSSGNWDGIDYEHLPSYAMQKYRKAFDRHDVNRNFAKYKEDLAEGKAKINAGTLFPYDIAGKYIDQLGIYTFYRSKAEDPILEAEWNALPDYIGKDINALVVCDTSGSMTIAVNQVRALPLKVSLSLAIYFAEHNRGDFHNLFIDFETTSKYINVRGKTLLQKLKSAYTGNCGSTNLENAFRLVLNTCRNNHLPQEEMPKALIVISDMQINDYGTGMQNWSFYREMKRRYAAVGYEIPKVIYWNVNAQTPTFLTEDPNREGVMLVSGLGAKTFAEIIDNISATAEELMLRCLDNERYDVISLD